MDQEVSRTSSFSMIDHNLEVEGEFTYLGSTIASNRTEQAHRLSSNSLWDNVMLTTKSNMVVYRA